MADTTEVIYADGYPGAIFNRWLSDYIGQGDLDEIDFKRYI